jgi:tRNA (guanine10-N2)-dimethyltransferase
VADAKALPIRKVDCVVTDPPYGRSATTLGWTTREIVKRTFDELAGVMDKGGRVCLAVPKTMKVSGVGEGFGFRHVESHFLYVHRSLTREIAVFERESK